MSTTTIPSHLKGLPHGIDITAPGGIGQLLTFHRATFGDARMSANDDDGDGQQPKPKAPRTFTQDELNAVAAEERRKTAEKFADYDDLKAKAERLDQSEQENQTELQKAIARAEKAEKDRDQEKADRENADRRAVAAEVASEKGVPASHISGSTREELEASAEALIAWRTGQKAGEEEEPPKVGGFIPDSGTGDLGPTPRTLASGRDRAAAKHATNKN
ncbi:MAG: hypothetical protein ACTIA5_01450 [Brachybacterium tyrofermentans]